ncbi:hypothetical protein HELRODRAFT_194758 [Helobdella robusta]|uniref:Chloride channel protein n=1 Tax=Helobdella robusta TaxID=6412 RepID=T1FWD6_HELRO|nr:hypothetical protein HELRODRAFT_194758 [Helobdella robusta]ESN89911.1 hypothetical protein HELRODRAFT_194758 [Helobdella robusta]
MMQMYSRRTVLQSINEDSLNSLPDDDDNIIQLSDDNDDQNRHGVATTFCCCRVKNVEADNNDNLGEEFGHLDAKLESLTYDNCENEVYLSEERNITYNKLKLKSFSRWLVMLLIGVVTALIACLIDVSVHQLSHVKFSLLAKFYNEGLNMTPTASLFRPMLMWCAWNVSFVAIASFLTVFGEPVAASSGIPQIKCYLNGVKIPRVVRIKTLFCKVVGVTCSVLGGLVVGKEGPMIHSGAVVAAGISQGRSTTFGFDLKMFAFFRTDQEKRDFISGGAAAGVSAAFGAPMGGVLFSLEEGASFWNQSLTWRIFFASIVSTFVLNVVLSWYHGVPWELSHPGLINFGKFQDMKYDMREIPLFILIGIIGGLLGALFNYINLKLTLFRLKNISRGWMKFTECLLIASTSTMAAFLLIYFNKDCQPIGKDPNPNPLQLFCPDGHSSSMATLWFQSPESSLKSLFHDPFGSYDHVTLLLFFVVYFFLACWTYGMSVPSGVFIPSLVIGASWGRLFSIPLKFIWPGQSEWIHPGKFALLGAASQLGGIVRMTLSLTVILIEATGSISFGLPLMIVLMVAKWTGDLFNMGIYDTHIHIQGVPFLGWEPPEMTSDTLAREVMSHPVTTFCEVESVRTVVETLTNESHDAFPVVKRSIGSRSTDEIIICETFGLLTGLITRSQLIVLLNHKYFIRHYDDETTNEQLTLSHFRDIYPRFPKIQDVVLSEEDMNRHIDLRNIMNPAPYTVYDNTTLPRIFKLFRGLGLSHLMVIDKYNELIGIVTRKDLARYHCSRKHFWSKPVVYELPMATQQIEK